MALIVGIPPLARRARLPAVVGLLLSGIVVGPYGLGIFPVHPAVADFFAELGKLMLIFFAGLEIDLALFRQARNRSILFGFWTTLIPQALGTAVGLWFGWSLIPAVVLGLPPQPAFSRKASTCQASSGPSWPDRRSMRRFAINRPMFLLTGTAILEFFGITLDSFRMAGGILLLLIGIHIVTGDSGKAAQNLVVQEQASALSEAKSGYRQIVVPFAMPLLVGPGVIANLILYASEARAIQSDTHDPGRVAGHDRQVSQPPWQGAPPSARATEPAVAPRF